MAVKQVILIRKDLSMRRGKEAAQASHSSIAFLISKLKQSARPSRYDGVDGVVDFHNWLGYNLPQDFDEWVETGTTKICLQVHSEEELLAIHQAALKANLEAHLVKDAGRTEFKGVETYTAVAIGPNQSEAIDKITGHLKLY